MLRVSTPLWAESRLELSISSSSARAGTRRLVARSASERSASSASTRSSQTAWLRDGERAVVVFERVAAGGPGIGVEHPAIGLPVAWQATPGVTAGAGLR